MLFFCPESNNMCLWKYL